MVDLTDDEFEAANERGRVVFETEPHARFARFDAVSGVVVLDLYNGCTFMFPPRLLQGLEDATDEELATVELSPTGFGVHWEALDADFTVGGLLAGRFGNAAYMKRHRERLRAILASESLPRASAA